MSARPSPPRSPPESVPGQRPRSTTCCGTPPWTSSRYAARTSSTPNRSSPPAGRENEPCCARSRSRQPPMKRHGSRRCPWRPVCRSSSGRCTPTTPGGWRSRELGPTRGSATHIRCSTVLPPNPRFEDFATEVTNRQPPQAPSPSAPVDDRANRLRGGILGLAIHDLPLIRAFLTATDRIVVHAAHDLDPVRIPGRVLVRRTGRRATRAHVRQLEPQLVARGVFRRPGRLGELHPVLRPGRLRRRHTSAQPGSRCSSGPAPGTGTSRNGNTCTTSLTARRLAILRRI